MYLILARYFRDTLFTYIFVDMISGRISPVKLKIGMSYHINSTFRQGVVRWLLTKGTDEKCEQQLY